MKMACLIIKFIQLKIYFDLYLYANTKDNNDNISSNINNLNNKLTQ